MAIGRGFVQFEGSRQAIGIVRSLVVLEQLLPPGIDILRQIIGASISVRRVGRSMVRLPNEVDAFTAAIPHHSGGVPLRARALHNGNHFDTPGFARRISSWSRNAGS